MSEIAAENTESEPLGSVPGAITGAAEQMIRESVKSSTDSAKSKERLRATRSKCASGI